MLAVNPTDPALAAWPGLDTLVRRVILRRPEEAELAPAATRRAASTARAAAPRGPRPELVPLTSRDDGAEAEALRHRAAQSRPRRSRRLTRFGLRAGRLAGGWRPSSASGGAALNPPVAEWRDTTAMPRLCRELLEKASGIRSRARSSCSR